MPRQNRTADDAKSEVARQSTRSGGPAPAAERQTSRSRAADRKEPAKTTTRRRSATGARAKERFQHGLEEGKEVQEQREARGPVDMAELQDVLARVMFPVEKDALLSRLTDSRADERAIEILRRMSATHFYSADEVTQAVGRAA